MQHVTAADRITGDHRDDRLGHPADLDVQVGYLEPADGLVVTGGCRVGPGDVAPARAPNALVAAGAERVRTLARQDHNPDPEVLARSRERVRELHHRLRPESVAHLRTVDRDLRDSGLGAGPKLVADIRVLRGWLPDDRHAP